MSIDVELFTYLKNLGAEDPPMGPYSLSKDKEKVEAVALARRLEKRIAMSDRLVILMAGMYCVIFVVGLVLAVSTLREPQLHTVILGGGAASLSAVVLRVGTLWREKAGLDMLVAVLPGLGSQERLAAVQSVYFGRKSARSSARRSASVVP